MDKILFDNLPVAKGKAICLYGKGGSGKTSLLRTLYKESTRFWEGNVLFLHAPSRIRETYPSFVIRERRDVREMEEEVEYLEENVDSFEGVSSGKEVLGILYTFIKNGTIGRGSLILIDSLDALSDGGDLRITSSLLSLLLDKEVALVFSVSGILGARRVEREMEEVEFYRVDDYKKGKVEKEGKEEVFSWYLEEMEDL